VSTGHRVPNKNGQQLTFIWSPQCQHLSGTFSLQLSECVTVLKLSAITTRPIISSRSSNPLSAYLTTVRVYQL